MATVVDACSPGNVCAITQCLNMKNLHCKIYHQLVEVHGEIIFVKQQIDGKIFKVGG